MKSFEDFTEEDEIVLLESRLLRKGAALVIAKSAKKHGNAAESHFNAAQRTFSRKPDKDLDQQMKILLKGLNQMTEGFIELRRQIGANTGLMTTAILMNERTDKQITSLMKRR